MSESTPALGGRLRVAVDVTSLLDAVTGVGTFTQALVDGLTSRPEVDVAPFAVTWRGRDRLRTVTGPSATVRGRPVPARLARALWLGSDLLTARDLAGPTDVVHGPNFVVPPGGGAVEVVTVHDLTAVRYPEMCTADVLQWPPLLRRALRRGAWVHTVSEHVADEVRDAFPAARGRVVAVPNGFTAPVDVAAADRAAVHQRVTGGAPFVLSLGTVEPRKDLPTLVAAFDLVAAADPHVRLVIAGGDGPPEAVAALAGAVAAARHGDRIARVGRVGDADRSALLRSASVVAYPSRYEGFGLVPLEAMAVDTPVVATAVGAIPEVVGDAARLVPGHDTAALAAALADVLHDEALRATLVAAGRERAGRFSWDTTVDGIVDLYRQAISSR